MIMNTKINPQDDYLIGVTNGLDLDCSVNEDGKYTCDLHECLSGLDVLGDGSEKVLELLGSSVLRRAQLVHSYPCDWRTKKPVILRGSRQWFIDTTGIKGDVMRQDPV
jgi:isoleucyl-tRNA synthetase